jgi:hypothetical protein
LRWTVSTRTLPSRRTSSRAFASTSKARTATFRDASRSRGSSCRTSPDHRAGPQARAEGLVSRRGAQALRAERGARGGRAAPPAGVEASPSAPPRPSSTGWTWSAHHLRRERGRGGRLLSSRPRAPTGAGS